MTEITREHLELAALAADYTVDIDWSTVAWLHIVGGPTVWCPQINMLDAARLAVNLQMRIIWLHDWVSAVRGGVDGIRSHDGTQADKERAYCEAVTLCAAGIGRLMREGGR